MVNESTCGAKKEGFWLSQVLVDFIGDGNLSMCKGAKDFFISRAHIMVNVIEK